MDKNKILPSLVCGFGVSVLTIIPGFNESKGSITCCFFVPLASIFAILLYQRTNFEEPPFKTGRAILIGFITGLFVALFTTFFDVIVTFITHTNEFVRAYPETEKMMREMNFEEAFRKINLGSVYQESLKLLKSADEDIRLRGFSLYYTTSILFSNLIVNSIFGMLGGLLGLLYINRKPKQ
jgi:predicted PurR-regulated permease PerM